EGRQDDDAGFGKFRPDSDHRIDTAHVGKPQVHKSHVGKVFPKTLNRFSAIGGLGHHQHVRLMPNDGGKALVKQRGIVNTKNANLLASVHLPLARQIPDSVLSVSSVLSSKLVAISRRGASKAVKLNGFL